MGTQNNKPLIRFTVNIPLKYNVSNVLHDEQDSEFVMDLTEPAVWQQEYNVQKPGKEAESGNAMEVLAFRLSCSRRSEDDRLPKNEFMLQIDNIIAESEEAAMQIVERDIHHICQILSLQTSIHNCNKQAYQPRVSPDYRNVSWKAREYIVPEKKDTIDTGVDEYYDENGKHIIRIHMAENTLACHNRCSIFVTLSVQLSTEEFLRYYTMDLDEETDFVMEEFFIALGKESVKSKFFHLFSIIEFIEKKYVELSNSERLLNTLQVEKMMETLEIPCDLNGESKDRVENSVKNTLLKMTNLGRASKLANILNTMGIHEIVLGGETICIDRKHAQAWIDLRNRSYHPDGSVAGKKYITMETAVTQLMETCQNILLFMMKGMLEN